MSEPIQRDAETAINNLAPARRVRGRWLRRFEHAFVFFVLLNIIFIVTPISAWVFKSLDCQDDLRKADYIICLGGNPNRIIESARLLNEGWADKLIVSNHGRFADDMRDVAVEWGADPARIIVDRNSFTTRDHPQGAREAAKLDPSKDICIIVTNYTHMKRSRACFVHAGYEHIIMQEPRWERRGRAPEESSWKSRFLIYPQLVYESAAWLEYKLRGAL
jgi:uncharacterized SAM-binding protein YcdF (DUF218 family)